VIREIVTVPDPILTLACFEVTDFGKDTFVDRLATDLRDTMESVGAAGLAAPQIGFQLQVFVMHSWPQPFINPVVVKEYPETWIAAEGCLSLPETCEPDNKIPIERAKRIKLRWKNVHGIQLTTKHRDWDARCALHELDHLSGILISDKRVAVPAGVEVAR
jgi:peptide deformylase